MSELTMRALLAGFVSGAAAALASTAVVLVAMARSQARGRAWLVGAAQARPALVGMLAVNGFMVAWTALGLVLGALYLRARAHYPGAGIASPNLAFTAGILVVVGLALGGVAFVRRGAVGWPAWSIAGLAAVAFGWMLPNLAR